MEGSEPTHALVPHFSSAGVTCSVRPRALTGQSRAQRQGSGRPACSRLLGTRVLDSLAQPGPQSPCPTTRNSLDFSDGFEPQTICGGRTWNSSEAPSSPQPWLFRRQVPSIQPLAYLLIWPPLSVPAEPTGSRHPILFLGSCHSPIYLKRANQPPRRGSKSTDLSALLKGLV